MRAISLEIHKYSLKFNFMQFIITKSGADIMAGRVVKLKLGKNKLSYVKPGLGFD